MFLLIRRLHLVIGVAGLVAFLATGLYMDRMHGHLRGYDDTVRMLYRSTHIYVLLASVANVMTGLYLQPAQVRWRQVLQLLGSLALLAAAPLFLLGFCTEPYLSELDRPWSKPAVYAVFTGTLLHLIAAMGRSRHAMDDHSA